MRVLYLGPNRGTSRLRFLALGRLGHQTEIIDPYDLIPGGYLPAVWALRTGALGLGGWVGRRVLAKIGTRRYDVVIVDGGENIAPSLVNSLKERAGCVINFNQDNPYVRRDGARWRLFLKALPFYDLAVVPRASSAIAARRAGARKVMQVNFTADELMHRPVILGDADRQRFATEVAFVGTWMPERGPFMDRLIERGVPLTIFGPQWRHVAAYPRVTDSVRANELLKTEDYVKAVAGTKIAIALLSKGNQDLHTTRSVEIPAIGTLLCGERTIDHMAMYIEDSEAIFFDDADECASKCLALLKNPARIKSVAEAGSRRAIENANFNEPLLRNILDMATGSAANVHGQGGPL